MADAALLTVDDYHARARELLSPDAYGFIAGGAADERTLDENERAFDRLLLRPRHLRGSGDPDPSGAVLSTPVRSPVLVAPWACHAIAHPGGEIATAGGAHDAGTIVVVPTRSSSAIEDVAAATPAPKWFQLYVFEDRTATAEVIARAVDAGYAGICLTIDFPVPGMRIRDRRSGFTMPAIEYGSLRQDPALAWSDVGWVRERAPGVPLILKGVLTAEDAELALQAGVDAIVVSNHGGRQLDGVAAGVDALPEVAGSVDGRIPVLVDGGIRRGTDVLKAIALGAEAVLVGRPAAWGLAVAGRDGVADVLGILRDELANAMALAGCRTLGEIGTDNVARVG